MTSFQRANSVVNELCCRITDGPELDSKLAELGKDVVYVGKVRDRTRLRYQRDLAELHGSVPPPTTFDIGKGLPDGVTQTPRKLPNRRERRSAEKVLSKLMRNMRLDKEKKLEAQMFFSKVEVSLNDSSLMNLGKLLSGINVNVNHSLSATEAIKEAIGNVFSIKNVSWGVVVIILILLFLHLRSTHKKSSTHGFMWMALIGILACVLLHYAGELTAYMLEFVRGLLSSVFDCVPEFLQRMLALRKPPTEAEAQGMFSGSTLTTLFGAAIVSYSISQDYTRGADPLRILMKTAALAPLIKNFSSVSDWFSETIQFCISSVCEFVGIPNFILFDSKAPDVTAWMAGVDGLLKRVNRSNEPLTLPLANEVDFLIATYRSLISKYMKDSPVLSALRSGMAMLQPLASKLERANLLGSSPRAQPFAVLIYGPPGVGKSKTMNYLARELAGIVCTDNEMQLLMENANALYFFRNVSTGYFDGFHGQPFIFYDEMNQCHKDLQTRENEIFEFIGLANTVPYMVHKADVESKGAIYARPRGIFATTNEVAFDKSISSIINSPEAFRRRWTLSLCLVPKAKYAFPDSLKSGNPLDRRLDKSKLAPVDFDRDVHEFYFWDFEHGTFNKRINSLSMDYDAMLDKCVQEYFRFQKEQDCAAGALTDAVKTGISKREMFAEKYGNKPVAVTQGLFSCVREYFSRDIPFPGISGDEPEVFVDADDFPQTAEYQHMVEYLREHLGVTTSTAFDLLAYANVYDYAGLEREWGTIVRRYKDLPTHEGWLDVLKANLSWLDDLKGKFAKFMTDNPIMSTLVGCATALSVGYYLFTKVFGSPSDCWDFYDEYGVAQTSPSDTTERHGPGRRTRRAAKRAGRTVHYWTDEYGNLPGCQMNSAKLSSEPILKQTIRMIKCNMYRFKCGLTDDVAGFVFFIKDQIAIMPRHFIDVLTDNFPDEHDAHFVLEPCFGKRATIAVNLRDCVSVHINKVDDGADADSDLEFMWIPCGQTHVDFTDRFIEDVEKPAGDFAISLYRCIDQAVAVGNSDAKITTAKYRAQAGDLYVLSEAIEYALPTRVGDCGALVVRTDRHSQKPVLMGIHVAGTGDTGIACPVSRGIVDAALRVFSKKLPAQVRKVKGEGVDAVAQMNFKAYVRPNQARIPDVPIISLSEEEVFHDIEIDVVAKRCGELEDVPDGTIPSDSVRELGRTKNPQPSKCPMSLETNIVPSPLQADVAFLGVPIKKRPANLTFVQDGPNLKRVMDIAREGYSPPCPNFDQELLSQIATRLAKEMAKRSMDEPKFRPWSWDQVFKGIDGDDFAKGMERSTSAGWPYSLYGEKRAKGKRAFLGEADSYDIDSPLCKALIAECEEYEDRLANSDMVRMVFNDFLKDELRALDKVELGKTRMISCAPLALTCLMRKYFMCFIKWFFENRLRNMMAPGVNPYSMDWDRLAKFMLEASNGTFGVWAGDYEKFDKTLCSKLMYVLWDFFKEFMAHFTERERIISYNLLMIVFNAFHMYDGVIYRWSGSVSSGVFITTFANSILNLVALIFAFFNYMHGDIPRVEGVDHKIVISELLDDFWEKVIPNVYLVTFGDDNLVAVDTSKMTITPKNIVTGVQKLGLTLADESKCGNIGEWKSIEQVTFLKRRFVYDRRLRRWTAPLDIDSILQTFYWRSKNVPLEEWPETVYNHLCELALHSPEIFDRYFPKYVEVLRKRFQFHPPHEDQIVIRRQLARRTTFY